MLGKHASQGIMQTCCSIATSLQYVILLELIVTGIWSIPNTQLNCKRSGRILHCKFCLHCGSERWVMWTQLHTLVTPYGTWCLPFSCCLFTGKVQKKTELSWRRSETWRGKSRLWQGEKWQEAVTHYLLLTVWQSLQYISSKPCLQVLFLGEAS